MKSLKKLALEFIPVFFGVVLALLFNNFNESRSDQAKIDGLLSKIELGNERNMENLTLQLAQNKRVLDSAMYYQEDTNMRVGDILDNSGGIRYIQFDLTAWNVLKNSELLVDVDYDLTSLLYLLNESIEADAETIDIPFLASDPDIKEEFISSLSDYLVSIEHRYYLCNEIQNLLLKRKK